MSNYSENAAMCRVDFFKESGKWYTTEAINFSCCDWSSSPVDALKEALMKQIGTKYSGMTAVCLEPYVEHSFPVIIRELG